VADDHADHFGVDTGLVEDCRGGVAGLVEKVVVSGLLADVSGFLDILPILQVVVLVAGEAVEAWPDEAQLRRGGDLAPLPECVNYPWDEGDDAVAGGGLRPRSVDPAVHGFHFVVVGVDEAPGGAVRATHPSAGAVAVVLPGEWHPLPGDVRRALVEVERRPGEAQALCLLHAL